MAGLKEFYSFIGKFRSLWENNQEASLQFSCTAGKAVVNLQVGLGHALPSQSVRKPEKPSRVRRRERRAAAASEAENASSVKATEEVIVPDEAAGQAAYTKDSEVTEKVEAEFELQVEAHPVCDDNDIIEAVQTNFHGILDDGKIDKNDPIRFLSVERITGKQSIRKN